MVLLPEPFGPIMGVNFALFYLKVQVLENEFSSMLTRKFLMDREDIVGSSSVEVKKAYCV